ncbi:TVP38/TMEM64 family protein [Bradyrhizobium sp. SZCCHNRI20481]|uniref:TVP38/TMEM64 family protein n=1 Tax=Bradyrhizobium sp. SZCCHNRI20481 TaxID=3057286 RepID=UPI0029167BF8|nr:VTT domain-containing protein [Bradyrhizobium sp. SZCCHNRI20481]
MTTTFIELITALQSAPLISMGALIIALVVGSLVFVPRPPLCIAGGLMLGFAAIPIAAFAATAGAVLGFLTSRHLLRSRFARAAQRRPVWQAAVEATNHEGWRLIVLLRLASPVPGTITNCLFGLSQIGLFPYTAATFFGQLPQIVMFVYMGAVGRSALNERGDSVVSLAMLMLGLCLTGFGIARVVRRAGVLLAQHQAA